MSLLNSDLKLKKLTSMLRTLHNVEIDFSSDESKIQETYDVYKQKKESRKEKLSFNAHIFDSTYNEANLICEAIHLYLTEIAPVKKRRHPKKKNNTRGK